MMASNKAAWLDGPKQNLRIGDADLPVPGPDDIVVKNNAIAINPVDYMQADSGFMINNWPKVLGSDIAGKVHSVGANVTRFKQGDRVVAMAMGIATGGPEDGAFQLYTRVSARLAALIPGDAPFKDASLLGMAVNTAVCGLNKAGFLELPFPSLNPKPTGKVIIVYGGSTSIGSMAIQLAKAAGIRVIATASPRNFDLCRECGASDVFDYKDSNLVVDVVTAVGKDTFAGAFVAVSNEESYSVVLSMLAKLGGGKMVTSQPAPENLPHNVAAASIMGPGEHAAPVWENFVTEALRNGTLKCLPKPVIVGKGLEALKEGLDKARAGVSAQKLVVEL